MDDPASLEGTFLLLRYVYVFLFLSWLFLLLSFPRAAIVVLGSVGFAWFAYFATVAPLGRPYALVPGTDRMFNMAMSSTAATGHSPFESYQVGFGDHEPFWRLLMRTLSLGEPENVLRIYYVLTPVVLMLLAASLYLGLRRDGDDASSAGSWELACIVFAVLLLNSSPHEKFGVFEAFWPMTFLLKPNHVLGFVLLPLWMRAFTSERGRARFWLGSALLALLSWVFLLHWSYVLLGLFVYPFLAPRLGHAPEWARSWLAAALSCLAAVPYVLFLYRNFPAEDTTVGRLVWESTSAFREGYYNVFAVSYEHGALFFLSLIGIGWMCRRRTKQDVAFLSLLLGCAVGWMIFVAAFWLRRTIEPEEFYFYTRFLLTVAAGSGVYVLARESHRLREWLGRAFAPFPQGLCLILLLTLPMTFPYWWNPGTMDRYYPRSLGAIPAPIERLTDWVRDRTSPDDVFLATPELANWITALAGRRVLLTGDHRPPNDYERREDLTRRLLTRGEPEPYDEAFEEYLVTHLALDEEYVSTYDVELSEIRSLPWLQLLYQDDGVFVFRIDRSALTPSSSGSRHPHQ